MQEQVSYVHGASEKPLIGETIGDHFDNICTRYANRQALIVRHQNVRISSRRSSTTSPAGCAASAFKQATASESGHPIILNGYSHSSQQQRRVCSRSTSIQPIGVPNWNTH